MFVPFLPPSDGSGTPGTFERVRLQRKTGFTTEADVPRGCDTFDLDEETFYRLARRDDLVQRPKRLLTFYRVKPQHASYTPPDRLFFEA